MCVNVCVHLSKCQVFQLSVIKHSAKIMWWVNEKTMHSTPSILHPPFSISPCLWLTDPIPLFSHSPVCVCMFGVFVVGLGGNVIRLEQLILLRWECTGRNNEGDRDKRDGYRRLFKCKWGKKRMGREGRWHMAGDFASLALSFCLCLFSSLLPHSSPISFIVSPFFVYYFLLLFFICSHHFNASLFPTISILATPFSCYFLYVVQNYSNVWIIQMPEAHLLGLIL